jgi:hypothetical protein
MSSLPRPLPGSDEYELLERIHALDGQLKYAQRHSPDYAHLTELIHELSRRYITLVDAKQERARKHGRIPN